VRKAGREIFGTLPNVLARCFGSIVLDGRAFRERNRGWSFVQRIGTLEINIRCLAGSFYRILSYLWPFPNTLLGLAIGMLPFLGDRHFAFRRGTLGHFILAVDQGSFNDSFEHEWVHVRRYVWFGPFFVPAYLLSNAWNWFAGKDYYLDNSFEKQARRYS